MFCGPKGIRTPDLLDANEARYQLRHRPVNNIYAITAKGLLVSDRSSGGATREEFADVCLDLGVVDESHSRVR